MFIFERLRAAVFYAGGRAVDLDCGFGERLKDSILKGYSPNSFDGQSLTKKMSLKLSSSGARPCWCN